MQRAVSVFEQRARGSAKRVCEMACWAAAYNKSRSFTNIHVSRILTTGASNSGAAATNRYEWGVGCAVYSERTKPERINRPGLFLIDLSIRLAYTNTTNQIRLRHA